MSVCDIPGIGLRVAPDQVPDPELDIPRDQDRGEAVLAGGCFWCTEAVFRRLDGVREVQPGYAGGAADAANYKAVCSGATGHAEVIRIVYDPARISYGELLKVFFAVAHDPIGAGAPEQAPLQHAILLTGKVGQQIDAIEAQLAHSVKDSLGRAYNRTEFLEQRRTMLQAWADYLDRLKEKPASPAPDHAGQKAGPSVREHDRPLTTIKTEL